MNILMLASSKGVGLTYHLARLSISLKKYGHNVMILSSPWEQAEGLSKELEKFGIERFISYHIDNISLRSIYKGKERIQQILKINDIDIIHANGVTHTLHAYLAIKSLPPSKKPAIVTSIHSIPTESIWQKHRWAFIITTLRKCSSIVLPVSDYTAKQLIKHGLASRKIITVHNAIELDVFDKAAEKSPVNLEMTRKGPIIMNVANLIKIKGQEYYLRSAAKVLKNHDARFYVVGDGPRKSYLQKLAQELGIAKAVIFTGRIHWPEIYYLLSHIADICVSPSISENFPFFILECMAAKKPIVATNVGGVSEAVIDCVNGYLVPPRDPDSLAEAILKLINNPSKAMEMGLEGRKLVEQKFNMDAIVRRLDDAYDQALKRKTYS